MTYAIKMDLSPLKDLVERLRELPGARSRAVLRRALTNASTPVLQTARQLAAVDFGLLRRSLGRKVVTYKSSGTVVVIIGPRRGFKLEVRPGKWADPVKYAHLVEKGHRIAIGGRLARKVKVLGKPVSQAATGRQGGTVAGRPFLQPALDQNKDTVLNIVRREIEDGILRNL